MPSSQFDVPNELNAHNIVSVLENTYTNYQSVEQARWNQSNIDFKFWAGDQDYVYSYFNFAPNYGFKKFFLNIIQQPVNMVTGYQRQHRKNFNVVPVENADQKTSDQLNKVLTYCSTKEYLLERFSDACEQSIIGGMTLVQPYLDYTTDFINGNLKWKVWEYNSFLIDPYFRNPDMSDCNFVWFQKYISKDEAMFQFPEQRDLISRLRGYNTTMGKFYFLPENYSISRENLLVLSYYWYRTTRRKKMLFNRKTGETTDFLDTEENIKEYVQVFDELEIIEREVPTWNVATMLNRELLYMGPNPLGGDDAPCVPVFWNYNPFMAEYSLRVTSLVRSLRDVNFLFNRRVIINHDISESSLNSGWIYEEDSVANEEVLKWSGQGKDVQVKAGTQRWPEKIVPNAVPPSDLELANQLLQLVPPISGVNQELMGMSQEKGLAGITQLLRQGAGLVTLQKYFDQWDRSLKLLGMLSMGILQRNWLPFKVSRILGEEPTEQFFTKNFQNYDVLPVEGLNTAIQQQQQFAQLLEFQQITGVQIPPRLLIENSTLQGKEELIDALEQQQQQQAQAQQTQQMLEMAVLESKLENLKADSVEKLAFAKERTGRTKSNDGLFEERIAEVSKNEASALKEKVLALKELVSTLQNYGEYETQLAAQDLSQMAQSQVAHEESAKVEGKEDASQDLKNSSIPPALGAENESQS